MANGTAHIQAPTITPQTPIIDVDMQALLPLDTIPEDTATYTETVTDTLVYMDGMDTVYELTDSSYITYDTMAERKAPTTLLSSNTIRNNNAETTYKKIGSGTNSISISASAAKTLTGGIYGINVSGMFDNASLPNDGTSNYGWQMLIDLAPDVLRFPSGSLSKFMHLLHNTDGTAAIGYGYDIYEIARYFDQSDGHIDSPSVAYIKTKDLDSLGTWMDDQQTSLYINFFNKWNAQQCETRRYIDDFIALVAQINAAHPGRPTVKVLLTLNINSETATECKAIATYLRNHNVNVVGIELGNETYDGFQAETMGFHNYKNHGGTSTGNYWDYINGRNYSGTDHTALFNVLSSAMEAPDAHNYIKAFKTGGGFPYKLGVCGKQHEQAYAFRLESPDGAAYDWNADLQATYDSIVAGTTKKKFDAVILHTYYAASSWGYIPINYLDTVHTCVDGSPTDGPWRFDIYDPRLKQTFDSIMGINGSAQGNFRAFITKTTLDSNCYKVSMDKFNETFHFNLAVADGGKELWTTEWNLKDNEDGLNNDVDKTKIQVFTNGFTHGVLLLQWWLKNLKMNFTSGYSPNFYTYATIQNFAGGATDFLTPADKQEGEFYSGADHCWFDPGGCTDLACLYDATFDERNYHVRRTTYFVAKLFSEIYKNDLKYQPATIFMDTKLGIAPTVFISGDNQFVYIYYSNASDSIVNCTLNANALKNLFPGASAITLDTATVHYAQASQLYSTSGKSALYNRTYINACYTGETAHPIEIDTIYDKVNMPDCTGAYAANSCLSMPALSFGYFKVPIAPYFTPPPRLLAEQQAITDVSIYPNPAGQVVWIKPTYAQEGTMEQTLSVSIVNMQGKELWRGAVSGTAQIPIATLPAGCYIVHSTTAQNTQFYKSLIKLN